MKNMKKMWDHRSCYNITAGFEGGVEKYEEGNYHAWTEA